MWSWKSKWAWNAWLHNKILQNWNTNQSCRLEDEISIEDANVALVSPLRYLSRQAIQIESAIKHRGPRGRILACAFSIISTLATSHILFITSSCSPLSALSFSNVWSTTHSAWIWKRIVGKFTFNSKQLQLDIWLKTFLVKKIRWKINLFDCCNKLC